MNKLVKIEDLARVCDQLRSNKKKIVLCHGVWDWLHPGHFAHLKAAKREGEILIVTVTPDRFVNKGPGRPLYNERVRVECLIELDCVDYVAVNQWPTSVETIRLLKPDVYVKGSEYATEEDDVTGAIKNEVAAVNEIGGRVHYTNEITFSSTENINRHLNPYPAEARDFIQGFRDRYSASDIIEAIQELKKLKVLVIGEAVIDEYYYCQGLGKPAKDNIIAVQYLSEEKFAGGSLILANHLAGFCRSVDLVTCLGNGYDHTPFILNHLKPNVRVKFFNNPDGTTIVKRRFVDPAFLVKMFEVAYLNEMQPEWLNKDISDYLNLAMSTECDLIIVLDYGHGVINDSLARQLSTSGKFVAVNTQANSANNGFNVITKYPRADYICLDEPELRLACRNKFDSVETLTKSISSQLDCTAISITRGHKGAITYNGKEFNSIPALADRPLDRIGAGDTYFAITAPCVASCFDMEMVGFIGNAAAALKIQTVGNRVAIEPVALLKFIQTILK